jgi:long-chain acyl-CoA synthetase
MPINEIVETWAIEKPEHAAFSIGEVSINFDELVNARNQTLSAIDSADIKQSTIQGTGNLIALNAVNHIGFAAQFLAATYGLNRCLLISSSMPLHQVKAAIDVLNPDLMLCVNCDIYDAKTFDFPIISSSDLDVVSPVLDSYSYVGDNAQSTFLISFTSGTTSAPKAFSRNRSSWIKSLRSSKTVFGVDQSTTTLAPGPLAHGLSLYAMAETLSAGAHFVSLEKFNADAVISLVDLYKVKRLVMVPTMLHALCELLERREIKIDDVTSIVSAGAKLQPSMLARLNRVLPNAMIFEYYGASELGFISYAARDVNDDGLDLGADVGTAFPGVEIEIRDELGQCLSVDHVGTICVKSDLMCDGYVMGGDGVGFKADSDWASVGDLGYLDTDNKLHLIGRSDGMIISGGNNIYPSQIEREILKTDGIKCAVVMGVADQYLGTKLVAIISHFQQNLTYDNLMMDMSTTLAKHSHPKIIYIVQEWPLTESGKISMQTLVQWIENSDDRLDPLQGDGQ